MGEDQTEFTAGKSSKDNTYTTHCIERKEQKNRNVHLAFIDLKKTYVVVPKEKIWKLGKDIGIKKELIKAVQQLYKRNREAVKLGQNISISTKELLQGYSLSLTLLEIHSKIIMKPWKKVYGWQ